MTQEIQAVDMGSKAASIALDQAAILVPVTHTKDLLNGISAGVSGLDLAYNDKVLRTKMIENVESSMRTARHERAAIIFANMRCLFKTIRWRWRCRISKPITAPAPSRQG